MTLHTAPCESPETTLGVEPEATDTEALEPAEVAIDGIDGWQALAYATLGRLLTDTELAAVVRLPTELALDLLFPDLPDAARQEALWALG